MTTSPSIKVSISDSYDGGNIKLISQTDPVISAGGRTAKCIISLNVKPDIYTEFEKVAHMQYFSFRSFVSGLHIRSDTQDGDAEGAKVLTVQYEIANAHAASYPEAWEGTTVCYTASGIDSPDDDAAWRRNLTTKYIDGKLVWNHVHGANGSTFFSYSPPYTYGRHMKLVADCAQSASVRGGACRKYRPAVESLGQTLDGREMECISIGSGDAIAWIIHRQHPGETSAEFFAEGLLHRLLGVGSDGELDKTAKRVLEIYRFYIVPCMCPDGAVRGHLRTNAAGANLNREWATMESNYKAPSLERSPEVHAVLKKMDSTGCDFFLDVHADEELPYVFFAGAQGTPKYGERLKRLHGFFVACFQRVNSDVQKKFGYPPPESQEKGLKGMNKATSQISNRFDCLGLTLEMPFKDCATNPNPEVGFGPERAKQLGRDLIETLEGIHGFLRANGIFWSDFSKDDEYVEPTDKFNDEEQ